MAEENDRIAEWVGATDVMINGCGKSACSHWQRVDVGSTSSVGDEVKRLNDGEISFVSRCRKDGRIIELGIVITRT